MLWRPRVECAAQGEGDGSGGSEEGASRVLGFGRGPRRPSTCELCIVQRGRLGRGQR